MEVFTSTQIMDGVSPSDSLPSPSNGGPLHNLQQEDPDSLDSGLVPPTNGDANSHSYDEANGHYTSNGAGHGSGIYLGAEGGGYGDGEDIPRLPSAIEAVLRGVWPFEKALWHSSPASVGLTHSNGAQIEPPGIMTTSSVTSRRAHSQQQLLTNKVEMVYGLLSMFSSGDRAEMSKTLLAMSSSPDSCLALRQSGCLPLLIQLLHGGCEGADVPSRETRLRASQALHNVVHANNDEKKGRREARVLRLLEQIRGYSDYLYERMERTGAGKGPLIEDDMDRHPCPAMAAVMKLSFDEEHRLAMCTLGGLHAIAELVKRDHEAHGATTPDNFCITLRRYAGMALTNLTFGAGGNKALVCSFSAFLRALVAQLNSPSQDLRQVTSSVVRNLSWRADSGSKQALREAGAVGGLMRAALTASKEATLKVILSAVWNLSAHCSVNKAEICAVEGALAFICTSLTYKSQSRTLAIIENAGGILRNISSHIAVREDLRQVLRDHSTLSVILSQLRSPSLTVVSNACGTLWNLSARCTRDQQSLWDLGAVPMLRSLINSKHKMISMGSSAALKNLLQAKPDGASLSDSKHGMGLPTLQARRQKALEQELDPSLAETCDNIESSPRASPTNVNPENNFFNGDPGLYGRQMFHSLDPRYGGNASNGGVMTESRDSVGSNHSTRSDNTHDRLQHLLARQQNGSSNGHRPVNLALTTTNQLGSTEISKCQTDRNGSSSNVDSNEHLNGERSNSAPNTSRTMNPSDPLYNLYNKYVANNRNTNNKKDSKHSKSQEDSVNKTNGTESETKEKHGNSEDKPEVQVDNYVRETSGESDNVDQPTDFSLRYSEEEDPNKKSKGTKPVKRVKPNTSKCVTATCDQEEGGENDEDYLGADDCVQSYCTEGTPLNFSTATSLTDLREQGGGGGTANREGRLGTQQEVDGEEEEAETPLAEGAADDGAGKEEQEEEGGRLSRFSSLSSISSGEISAAHEDELEEDSDLQELVLAEGERVAAAAAKAAALQSSPEHTSGGSSNNNDDGAVAATQEQQEQEWSAGVTPLMFSRTTSLGSLSSFPQQPPLDDSGSVVSEFSRLASGAVSPSDLPDSPSQTMPPSPRHHHQHRPPAHPHHLTNNSSSNNNNNGQFGVTSSLGVFNDSPRQFNEEGTPCHMSQGTSLSSLTMDDTPHAMAATVASSSKTTTSAATTSSNSSLSQPPFTSNRVRGDGKDGGSNSAVATPRNIRNLTPRTSSIPRPQSLGQDQERSRSSDPHGTLSPPGGAGATAGAGGTRGRSKEKRVHDADGDKLLAACINSGLPNKHSGDTAKTPLKSPRTPALSTPSVPPPPPPPPPPRLTGSGDHNWSGRVSNIPINTVNLQVTTTALSLTATQGGGDTLHTYRTEDTPANISQAGSTSDLSQLSVDGRPVGAPTSMRKPLGPSHALLLQNGGDTDSSDTDGLLDRCIQAAMPKLRSIKGKPPSPRHNHGIPASSRPGAGRPLSGSPLSPCSGPPTALPRKSSSSVTASPHASPRHRPVPVARVSPAMKPPTRPDPNSSTIEQKHSLTNGKLSHYNEEEVKNWGEIEGTPMGFSNATSLSDLTVDSCEQEPKVKKPSNLPRAETPKKYATEGTPANFSRCDSLSSLSCDDDGGQLTSRLANDQQRHVNIATSQKPAPETDEQPQQFNVEDTPAILSRQSSLSSIDGVACGTKNPRKASQQLVGEASATRDFGVEGTPVCFSRNSSLSSLSVESYPEETTPSEQALLQQCINQGMPRPEQRQSRGNVVRGNKRGKSGSRIPGLAQSPGRSPARSPGRTIPGVPMQRLQLVPISTNEATRENSLHTEAESSKLRTDIEQSEKNKLNRYSNQCQDDDQSAIDDITEVTEPISDVTTAPIAEVTTRKANRGVSGSALNRSPGETSSSPEEKQSSSDETRGSSGREGTVDSIHGLGSDVSMTDSMLVATEALRVARAVEGQGHDGRSSDDTSIMSQSITSEGLLENIVAPSAMNSIMSLSTSLNDEHQRAQQRKALECRHTRKIPAMVRRALGDQEMSDVNGTNGGSLASSCHSNLDNVVPPSFMEADDMESSMISVASITSEVADPRHSPPSLTSSIPSEAMAAIEAPAQQLAKLFLKEARYQSSTVTLSAGEDTSTCQEVTELDKDDTLGMNDTATDTYPGADDLSGDIPELPHDSPINRRKNSSPQVTPSMLRKAMHNDRFRTFTRGEKSASPQVSGEVPSTKSSPSATVRSSITPKQRRAEQGDRFRTRIISTEDEPEELESPITPTAENPMGVPKQRRSLREKRQSNPLRYQTRTIESATTPKAPQEDGLIEFRDGAELDLTAEQLEALSQDANIVICTLNENREANTADLLHGLSQENILDIETLSLISSDEDDNTFDVESPLSPATPTRPRIVKPGEQCQANTQDDEGAKGIRGRRKGLYSGVRKAQAAIKPTQQAQPDAPVRAVPTTAAAFKPTPRTTQYPQLQQQTTTATIQTAPGSPKLPRATRASALRHKVGRVGGGSSSSSSPASSAGSSPRMGAATRTRVPPPSTHATQYTTVKRQNTFTKDDREEQQQQTTGKALSKPKYRKDSVQPMSARQVSPKAGNQDGQFGLLRSPQPKSCSLTRDARAPTANDMADWNKDAKTGKSGKKDVTSRIASLWKKVEKAQSTAKPKENDARVWITRTKSKVPDLQSPPPLIRSSTYEKLTVGGESRSDSERTDSSKGKTRLGLKLSRLRGRDTKSSPPSEAGTPVDARPHCLVSPNRSGSASGSRLRLAPSGSRLVDTVSDQQTTATPTDTSKRISRLGSFFVPDGEDETSSPVRSPQSALVAPFNYQPPSSYSPAGSRSSSISSGSQRRPPTEERGSAATAAAAAAANASTRIPLPKTIVMSNNPRDDNGNAPFV
uniref:Adenomatous polyposis coli homolog n=1 Tax=Hirondellea gigas TaxID=1518452 RepID=A0A6A7FVB8_9CRUS